MEEELSILLPPLGSQGKCALRGVTFEVAAETAGGAECGGQITQWSEKIPTYLTHSGRIALAAHLIPHRLQSADTNVQSPKRFRASILGGTLTPTEIYPCHSCEPGGEAEEPNAEGGPEGKNKKSGLLGGGSLPLEQPTS